MTDLDWLQSWYLEQADGRWEHEYGIAIDTLDNPGWSLKVNLVGTPFESLPERTFNVETSERDWVVCKMANGRYEGHGGPLNLSTLISIFRRFVSDSGSPEMPKATSGSAH